MWKIFILGLLLILAGPLFCAASGTLLVKALEPKEARKEWPTTAGEITASSTYREALSDDNLNMRVEFTYEVTGELHRQTQEWPVGEEFFGRPDQFTRAAQAEFAVGKVVPVYYNPANPDEAVVEPYAADFGLLIYPLGLAFAVLVGAAIALPVLGIRLIWQGFRGGATQPGAVLLAAMPRELRDWWRQR